jgi:S-formylglutathione hydrolase FrmB
VSVSLLSGWLPWTLRIVAVVAVVAAVGWRARRRAVLVTVGVAVVVASVVSAFAGAALGLTEPLPTELWLWVGVLVFALVMIGVARGWRRGAAAVAMLLAAVSGASAVNGFVGYYPTVGDAFGELTGQPVPAQVGMARLSSVDRTTTTGRVVPVDIPGTFSHFPHRQEYVYLPPVWFRHRHHARLPVIEMIGGEYAAPDNWIRAGHAVTTANAYASHHHGWAPILVFADASGGFSVDTECVNGPRGNAESHLLKDIPAYVSARFHASRTEWAVAGWSMGGTCAVDLAVEHPHRFHHFLDISGDIGPNSGDRQSTVDKLYGGSAAAWAAHDPMTLLAHHRRYLGVSGLFVDGYRERRTISVAYRLADACRRDGIASVVLVRPGGHTWPFAGRAFAETLPRFVSSFTPPV